MSFRKLDIRFLNTWKFSLLTWRIVDSFHHYSGVEKKFFDKIV